MKEGIDSKAVEVWALCSQLIEKENYHRLGVFNGDKYIIFSDDAKTKVLLSNLINELSDVNLADGNDHVLCNYIEEEFSKELIVLLDEYKEISDSNEDKIQDISRGISSLEEKLIGAKEKVSITDGELKPLLNDIKEFCRPLIEEQKERNARSRR